MSKTILPFYERELGNISALIREFAEQYPQLASTLGFVDGECEDANVQRIVEAMVMLGARILQQLEDSYPNFTGTLLDMNYPHATQPFPSTSIARFDYSDGDAPAMSGVTTIPRGSLMTTIEHKGMVCHFKNAYAVTIAPVVLSQVSFTAGGGAPPGARLPIETTAMLRIVIDGKSPTGGLGQLGLPSMRVFIDGDPSLRATLRDLLFMNILGSYVQADGSNVWSTLETTPITAVGFSETDALIPFTARSHPALRWLSEYFAFPEKFNFIDVDLARLCQSMPLATKRLTLHLAVGGVLPDSDRARILAPLSSRNLLLSCTPVVNLFKRAASPIDLSHIKTEYPLLACAECPASFDIHSVDSVHLMRDTQNGSEVTEFHPYYSMRHGVAGGRKGHYYSIRRDAILAQTSPGRETQFGLVDIDHNPLAMETSTVSIMLTCTNRDLPCGLRVGLPVGDLKLAGYDFPIRLLRRPTPPLRFSANAHWRLISQLSLNHHSLVQEDLEAFTEMLALYDLVQSDASRRQIRGIVGLAHSSARAWIMDDHGGARVHGIEVRITLEEAAFVGSGMHAFVQLLDHFLGMYAHLNTFTQLVILSSASGKELIRCLPRSGSGTLV
jgi:type VI secretion system protein ImpG